MEVLATRDGRRKSTAIPLMCRVFHHFSVRLQTKVKGATFVAPFRLLTDSLEVELQRKLNQSWVSSSGDASKIERSNA